jgi:hypothetical protein
MHRLNCEQKIMNTNVHPVTTPQDAVSQFVGEQFTEWLTEYIEHQVGSWESLGLIARAIPKPDKIKKFMGQRYIVSQVFTGGKDSDPGFLGFAIANLSESPEPMAEHVLDIVQQKRQDELAVNNGSKKDVWQKLLRAVGLADEEIKRLEAKDAARNYASELSDLYSNADWQTVLAAFYTHEKCITVEYGPVSEMVKNTLSLPNSDLEILSGKMKNDNKHLIEAKHNLERLAVDEEGKNLIFEGVDRQLTARRDFYDALAKYLYE